jgi:hypothetical protein
MESIKSVHKVLGLCLQSVTFLDIMIRRLTFLVGLVIIIACTETTTAQSCACDYCVCEATSVLTSTRSCVCQYCACGTVPTTTTATTRLTVATTTTSQTTTTTTTIRPTTTTARPATTTTSLLQSCVCQYCVCGTIPTTSATNTTIKTTT